MKSTPETAKGLLEIRKYSNRRYYDTEDKQAYHVGISYLVNALKYIDLSPSQREDKEYRDSHIKAFWEE